MNKWEGHSDMKIGIILALQQLYVTVALILLSSSATAAITFPQVFAAADGSDERISVMPQSRHPRTRDWCGNGPRINPAKLKIVYDVQHDKRDVIFGSNYEQFVEDAIRPILAASCADKAPRMVSLYFFRGDDFEHYDMMRYRLVDDAGQNVVALLANTRNEKHPHYKAVAAMESLGSCEGQAFCELFGGIYLNAIFRGDNELVRQLDRQIAEEVASNPNMAGYNKFASIITGEQHGVLADSSYLKMLAVYYMGQYSSDFSSSPGESCLRPGARSITRKATVPVVNFEDQFGIPQGSTGGWEFGQVYQINEGFVALCNKICGAGGSSGVDMMSHGLGSYKLRAVLVGLQQLISRYKCDSPEVRQFEDNLVTLTLKSLSREEQGTEIIVAPDDEPTVSAVDRIRAAQPAFEEIEQRDSERRIAAARVEPEQPGQASITYREAGAQFLAANRSKGGVVATDSGLQYRILAPGNGRRPTTNDAVRVHEFGTMSDGTVIDENFRCCEQALTINMSQVIAGWAEGLKQIGEGGKIRLFIPPELAYGDREVGAVRAGATLIYEIELLEIL